MSKSRDHGVLLKDGKEREKKYDWLLAVEPYEKAQTIAHRQRDFSLAANTCERIGYCYHRAAMQANDQAEFKNRMLLASNSYNKAAKLFGEARGQRKLAEICHCRAAAAYVDSQRNPDIASRMELLAECARLEKEALKHYGEAGNRPGLGKAYNELNTYLLDQLNLERNRQTRQEVLREALTYGYKAIDLLSELEEKHELARAYYATSIYCDIATKVLEPERKGTYAQEALSYSKKSVELSGQIGDHFLLGMSSISAGSAIADFTDRPDAAGEYFENALECGTRTRDNFVIGRASYLLAYLMAWKMIAEEDPEKMREESKNCENYCQQAIHHFKSISNDQGIASSYYWYAENYSILAKSAETNLKKESLLKKSIETAQLGLEHAQRSGSINAVWFILHPLSKSLFHLSTIEADVEARKQLLEKSLQYREENIKALEQAMPYYFWNNGVYHNYLALIQAELARIESDGSQKTRLLEDAVKSAEDCTSLCLKSGTLSQGQWATLAGYYSDFAGILNQLYLVTGSAELLSRLRETLRGAVKAYEKAHLPSRAAESYWRLAKVYDKSRDLAESARSFDLAHAQYVRAAEKISLLKSFYLDHAAYMKGWSEIQRARDCHLKREYDQAEKHYEKAASLHKSAKSWKYLVSNYLAWAQLENGENLSRGEQPGEAKLVFQRAAGLFAEAKKSIQTRLEAIKIGEEREMVEDLVKASDLRREYCLGRVALEEAKILDRKGEHYSSSEKYGSAAETFQHLTQESELEQDRRELQLIAILAKAWRKMTQAEVEASPSLYLDASTLFEQARALSQDEKAKMLALGHSHFCRALEAGTRFADTMEETFHAVAVRQLESAANYYLRAGSKKASEYAKATGLLFDAYVHMDNAKKEVNPEKKAKLYTVTEKVLEASADSFKKADHSDKNDQVLRLLENVREEKELALTLSEIVHAPPMVSTTAAFATPTPSHEQAVGLDRFEHAYVQTHITTSEEVSLGEEINIGLDLVNVGKEAALLVSIKELVPPSFDLAKVPENHDIKNDTLDVKGKRLEPQKIESISFSVKPTKIGVTNLSPLITYVDELGRFQTCRPDAVQITVLSPAGFQFKTENAQKVFEYLTKAFIQDYMKQRLTLEKSGWRTLMQIMENAHVPKSSIYGAIGRRGPAIAELEARGLIEARIFLGQRGRGGRILQARIFYERETIKRHVDHQVMKINEK